MNNANRWAICLFLMITMIATVWYILANTVTVKENCELNCISFNGHILFFGVVITIWSIVWVGMKMELEFP